MGAWGSCKCYPATPRLAGCDPEGGQGQAGMPTLFMPTLFILVRSEPLASCCTESMPSFTLLPHAKDKSVISQ